MGLLNPLSFFQNGGRRKMKPIILLIISLIANSAFGEMMPPYKATLYDILSAVSQEEYPSYKDGILVIPRVDIAERVGLFQDGKFTFTNGVWQLVDFKVAETQTLLSPVIKSVEVITTDSFPVQVFLKVRGELSYCSLNNSIGKTPQRLTGNLFEITIHEINGNRYACDGDGGEYYPRYETVIPLYVYGLKAGIYQYTLNGGRALNPSCGIPCSVTNYYVPTAFTGTFELKKNNVFPVENTWTW